MTTAQVLVCGNDGIGIEVEAPATLITNAIVGLDRTGVAAVPNREDGIFIKSTATGAQVGTASKCGGVAVSGNLNLNDDDTPTGSAIEIAAPNVTVVNTFVGTDLAGAAAVPNGFNGIVIQEGAAGARIGAEGEYGTVISSGNACSGIVSRAKRVVIINTLVGVGIDPTTLVLKSRALSRNQIGEAGRKAAYCTAVEISYAQPKPQQTPLSVDVAGTILGTELGPVRAVNAPTSSSNERTNDILYGLAAVRFPRTENRPLPPAPLFWA